VIITVDKEFSSAKVSHELPESSMTQHFVACSLVVKVMFMGSREVTDLPSHHYK
jgi:hypothetical protein